MSETVKTEVRGRVLVIRLEREAKRNAIDVEMAEGIDEALNLLEDDDELRSIGERYAKGEMLTGEVKQRLIDVLVPLVEGHQAARARVTSDTVRDFMAVRPLEF